MKTVEERTAYARGYDAGNYDSAYGFDGGFSKKARRLEKKSTTPKDDAWIIGYMLGFYSSYETGEIRNTEHRDAITALREAGLDK